MAPHIEFIHASEFLRCPTMKKTTLINVSCLETGQTRTCPVEVAAKAKIAIDKMLQVSAQIKRQA